MNASMERAYKILNSFNEEELQGFILMFGNRETAHKGRSDNAKSEEFAKLSQAFSTLGEDCFSNGRDPQYQNEREKL